MHNFNLLHPVIRINLLLLCLEYHKEQDKY